MRKTFTLFLSILIVFTTSCKTNNSAEDILLGFCAEYPIDSKIYSSVSDGVHTEIIDAEMLDALYGIKEIPIREFALVLYGKVNTVREIGVFITNNGDNEIEILELASKRIDFLSSFADGEGFIKKYRGVLVYGFVEDASYAEAVFDSII